MDALKELGSRELLNLRPDCSADLLCQSTWNDQTFQLGHCSGKAWLVVLLGDEAEVTNVARCGYESWHGLVASELPVGFAPHRLCLPRFDVTGGRHWRQLHLAFDDVEYLVGLGSHEVLGLTLVDGPHAQLLHQAQELRLITLTVLLMSLRRSTLAPSPLGWRAFR